MFRIPIHTGSTVDNERGNRPYVCKHNLGQLFEERDIPPTCDAMLKRRKRGQRAPNRCAVRVRIPVNFENDGVDYQTNNGWVRRTMLVVSADDALAGAKVKSGDYWFWLEAD